MKKKKATPVESVVDLVLAGANAFLAAEEFVAHNWTWGAMWAWFALFFVWQVYATWAWRQEDQDKTSHLRKIWKSKF